MSANDGAPVEGAAAPHAATKTPNKTEIAARLRQAAEMLRLRGESPYRAGAYETGADALDEMTEDFAAVVSAGRLTELRGIGASLAATITDLARTGHSPTLDAIMGQMPVGLLELSMARLPGLTLRRIQILHDRLGVSSADELRQALQSGAVESIKGFGAQTVAKLREGMAKLDSAESTPSLVLLVDAREWAGRLLAHLLETADVLRAEVVGSVRRCVETVGDVNLMIASDAPEAAIAALASYPAVARVISRDARGCAVRLSNGIGVTLQAETVQTFGTAMLMATGSAAHCRRLAERARARGLQWPISDADDEVAVYAHLGLPFIPPELREDAGELEAADGGDTFEDLITEADIRGMVHCHTTHSDGRNTVAEMARAAAAMGMSYITITDHSPTASYAGGVTAEELPEQWGEIADAQAEVAIRLLRGTESDILRDGNLDYSSAVLESLDVVIASIHERHRMEPADMTARLVRAMEQPLFKIWGHALGRLLLRREAIGCDVERVLDAVAASPAAIEINGSPHRLDLPAEWIRVARHRKIKFVISTDAHSTAELGNLTFGVALARRGGLRRSDVLNTLPVDEFMAAVRPSRPVQGAS